MVRVLVVDDEPLVRAGLRLVLDPGSGIEIVGEAGDGVAGVWAAQDLRPDVVLMDVRMPGGDGIEAVGQIRAAGLGCRILMLTAFDTDEFVLSALRAGADGFLLKTEDPDLIERAVLGAADGAAMISAPVRVAQVIVSRGLKPTCFTKKVSSLAYVPCGFQAKP